MGKQVSILFAKNGYSIIVTDKNKKGIDKNVDEIKRIGESA